VLPVENSSLSLFDLPIEVGRITCNLLALTPLIEQAEIKWLTASLKSAAASHG
jgi:hypothetical protein